MRKRLAEYRRPKFIHWKTPKAFTRKDDLKPFKTPGEAKKQLGQDFNDWSSILSQNSIQASFAIIAANWAVHGDKGSILGNVWAKWSIVIVLILLGVNLICACIMSVLHEERYEYAEDNGSQWKIEYEKSEEDRYWPYTAGIFYIGSSLRLVKTIAPIVSGILFAGSLF